MLEQLVLEQVDAKHGEETTSPRNSPVFVRKKKTGKWWITDLRVINKKIQTMGYPVGDYRFLLKKHTFIRGNGCDGHTDTT